MRILLIDHDSDSSTKLIKALEAKGIHCNHVDNSHMAVSSAAYCNPDLILIESKSVSEATMEIVKQLRQSEQTENTPLMFLSAERVTGDRLEGLHLGCVEYIEEPVDINSLVDTLVGYNCINSIRRITKELSAGLKSLEAKYAC